MNKEEEKIKKIKEDHQLLLEKVKKCLVENKGNVTESLESIMSVLDFDGESIKKYVALVKSQDLILSFIEEIINANSYEDIINIRKKLNYHINKIKDEIKKRNIKPEIITAYQDYVSDTRKNISTYIRYLKRNNNIMEIEKLYANLEQLSDEEKEKLKLLLKRELQYNKRNLNPKPSKIKMESEKAVEDNSSSNDMQDDTVSSEEDFLADNSNDSVESTSDDDISNKTLLEDEDFGVKRSTFIFPTKISELEFEDAKAFFNSRISVMNTQYGIQKTFDYGRNRAVNFLRFLGNIPKIIINKRIIKSMERDYCIYYSGSDLESYIEYLRERNSIKQGLRCIFDRSYLFSRGAKYLNRHEKCSRWLFEFCKNNDLDLPLSGNYSK